MDYSFNAKVAAKYGVEEAVLIHNLYWWISKNKANNKHIYDGRVWTYNSRKAFAELFPFWTEKQLRRICNSLEKNCAVIVGNYNKNPMDRTIWYTLTDDVLALYGEQTIQQKHSDNVESTVFVNEQEKNTKNSTNVCICPNGQMQMPERSNASDQIGECKSSNGQMQVTEQANVSNINTNNKQNINPNINSNITPLPPNLTKAQQELLRIVVSCDSLSNKMKFQLFKWLAYKNYKYNTVSLNELLDMVNHYIEEYGEERVLEVLRISMANAYVGIVWNLLKGNNGTKTFQDSRRKRTYEEEFY